MLVVKCALTKASFAEVLPCKGTAPPHCVFALVAMLVALGHHHFTLKSDDEPGIIDLKRRAAQECRDMHGMAVLPEESPHADSQPNGLVEERYVRSRPSPARCVLPQASSMAPTLVRSIPFYRG